MHQYRWLAPADGGVQHWPSNSAKFRRKPPRAQRRLCFSSTWPWLGDWGSRVQISALRPLKPLRSLTISEMRSRQATGRGGRVGTVSAPRGRIIAGQRCGPPPWFRSQGLTLRHRSLDRMAGAAGSYQRVQDSSPCAPTKIPKPCKILAGPCRCRACAVDWLATIWAPDERR